MEQAFLDLIAAKQRFLLSGHEHPDGDCVGSQAALYHLLAQLGKEAAILNPDRLSRPHEFLQRHTPFAEYGVDGGLPEVDVVVLLDCAQLSRLNTLGERIRGSGAVIAVVDHHVDSDKGDAAVHYVDSTAASTGMLVHRLYRALDLPISKPAAEGIFLSIISDTGWFRYSNTDANVLAVAAELVEQGVDPSSMYDHIFRHNHAESVKLLESILGTHRRVLNGKFAYACINKAGMAWASRIDFDTDLALEPIRSVEGIEVVALLKERFDGGVKLSLRAVGDVDVRRIASEFGGGGHVKAAGATLETSLEKSVEVLELKVKQALVAAGVMGDDA